MKIKKMVCCIIAAAIVSVTLFSGCKTSDGNNSSSDKGTSQVISEGSSATDNSAVPESGKQSVSITPKVWKASDNDGNYIYLMGSIHAADDSVYNMPDYFEAAFEDCNAVAFEADVTSVTDNLDSAIGLMTKMMYNDGTTIKDHISEKLYNKMQSVLTEKNLYLSLYDKFKPIMWMSLLENASITDSGLKAETGVDMVLTKRAKQSNKEIIELESLDEQLELFNNLSDETTEMILSSYIENDNISKQAQSVKDLYEKWKNGTITAEDVAEDLDTESLTDEQKKLYEEYNNSLLSNRNSEMYKKTKELASGDKTVMIIVGMAHFLGDDGIIHLLEEDGYTVTSLSSDNFLKEIPDAAPYASADDISDKENTEGSQLDIAA